MDFENLSDWIKIKDEIIKHIPQIPSGVGAYSQWIGRVGNLKAAGYELEEVQAWCGEEDGLSEEKWEQVPQKETELEARKILFSIAKKNGFVYEGQTKTKKEVKRYKLPSTPEATEDAVSNTIKLFQTMYDKDDILYICNGRFSDQTKKVVPDGGSIVGVPVSTFTPEVLKGFLQFDKGMYIQYNEVDAETFEAYKTSKKNGSIKNEHIKSFKYAYIEADPAEGVSVRDFFNDSMEKLEKMDLPWLAHVFSGNKSIHTIIRLDATSKEEYASRLKAIHNYCKKCGYIVDDAVKNPARWGRFPCCKRDKSFQYIMEINENFCSYEAWEKRHTYKSELLDHKGNIDSASMLDFIHDLGFASCVDGADAVLVQIEGKMVEKIHQKKMIGIVNEAVKIAEPKILSKSQVFLGGKSANYFANLPFVNISKHTDTANSVYLYFHNQFLEITAEKIIPHDYSQMNGFLWKGKMPSMERNFCLSASEGEKSIYEKFIENITSDKTENGFEPNQKNKKAAMSIIGYLLSRYKKPSEAKAVFLTEKAAGAEEADATGGTGKGIFVNALEQYRVEGEIDGKDLKTEDRFTFSAYEEGQSLYTIQDVSSSFDIKSLYNKITNKFIVEKKCQNKKIIPFQEAPKVIITSNYILRGMDEGSTDRRLIIFELENYYSTFFTPYQDFGGTFFDGDWDENEWQKFDSFMIKCVQEYLQHGVSSVVTDGLARKKKEASVVGNIDIFWEDWTYGYTIGKGQYAVNHKVKEGEFYSSSTVYKLYKEWCNENKIVSRLNHISFSRKLKGYLEDKMIPERTKTERGWSFFPKGIEAEAEEEAPF